MIEPNASGATILARSGHYFDFLHPEMSVITPRDIAGALAKTCRFAGHTRQFYSVAQHSVIASHIVPAEDAYAALMHDAAEAFIGDIPTPLKRLLPDFRAIEQHVESVIADRFQFPNPMPESVRTADMMLLKRERLDLLPRSADEWTGLADVPLLDEPIQPIDWREAETLWFDRFHSLRGIL